MERRLAAILAADVVGYSSLMGEDEAGTLATLKAHRTDFIDPTVAAHGGRIVKLMGDGALVEFPSVVDAVTCAVAVQQGMAERNADIPDNDRIVFRIGINLGDVIIEGDDIYGDGVNIAARMEGLAEPGGICLSAKVHEEVKNKLDVGYEDLGLKNVKNVIEPIHVFSVTTDASSGSRVPIDGQQLALPSKPSIAVLPFDNMSGDPEQEFFVDGITEDIITELSKFRSIFVIARNSSFVYKGGAKDIKQVGSELGVRYVLEGSVRRSASRIRVTAQLIEAATGNHLWAERYDRTLDDVFALQDEMTETIVKAIQPELEVAERERARRKPPESMDAWESYQRGLWHIYQMTGEDTALAGKYFQESLNRTPHYAPALAGKAYVTFVNVVMDYDAAKSQDRDRLLAEAEDLAALAIRIDDRDAYAQFVLGRLLCIKGDFDESIEHHRLAIDLNPNSAIAYYGMGFVLAVGGQPAEAIAMFDMALRLSPKDQYRWGFNNMKAFALVLTKDYDAAIEAGREGMRRGPQVFWPYCQVISALGHMDRVEEAQRVVADLLRLKPDFSTETIDKTIRIKNASDRDHYLAGLRMAGLPD